MNSAAKFDPADPWRTSCGVEGYSRETFEGETSLLTELEIFGWLKFREALVNGLQPDRHKGALEIHYMKRGHLRWWAEADECEFSTGRVFIVRPGELHGGDGGAIQPCEHYWLRIKLPQKGKGLPQLTPNETENLLNSFQQIQIRSFPVSAEVNKFYERLHEEHRNPTNTHSVLMARSMLHGLLITILRDYDNHIQSSAQNASRMTWQVRRAIEWLNANYRDPELKVDQLSASFGKSATVMRSRFKMETGYTPHEYVLCKRIEDARQMLAGSSKDVTTIAYELGFSSSQYFATVFRRQTGLTPSEFRRKNTGMLQSKA